MFTIQYNSFYGLANLLANNNIAEEEHEALHYFLTEHIPGTNFPIENAKTIKKLFATIGNEQLNKIAEEFDSLIGLCIFELLPWAVKQSWHEKINVILLMENWSFSYHASQNGKKYAINLNVEDRLTILSEQLDIMAYTKIYAPVRFTHLFICWFNQFTRSDKFEWFSTANTIKDHEFQKLLLLIESICKSIEHCQILSKDCHHGFLFSIRHVLPKLNQIRLDETFSLLLRSHMLSDKQKSLILESSELTPCWLNKSFVDDLKKLLKDQDNSDAFIYYSIPFVKKKYSSPPTPEDLEAHKQLISIYAPSLSPSLEILKTEDFTSQHDIYQLLKSAIQPIEQYELSEIIME